jgi:hypothetical protein
MNRNVIPAFVLAVFAACSTPSSVAPLSVPLNYKPMLNVAEYPTLPACAAFSKITVTDARADKALGTRFVEGKKAPGAPVTASTDVADWVRAGVAGAIHHSSASTDKAGAPELSVTIEQITTSENVLHRSGYEGRIELTFELRHGGTSCWKERADGSSENYGYAGSVENYQETLNHALDRAVVHALSSADFKKSVCGCS